MNERRRERERGGGGWREEEEEREGERKQSIVERSNMQCPLLVGSTNRFIYITAAVPFVQRVQVVGQEGHRRFRRSLYSCSAQCMTLYS